MGKMKIHEIKEFLDEKAALYQSRAFIDDDPIAVPHQFSRQGDIECAGFIAATIAWGNRKSILKNADTILNAMDYQPFEYILNYNKKEQKYWKSKGSLHRTLNGSDLDFLIRGLQGILQQEKGLEDAFVTHSGEAIEGIKQFRSLMLRASHEQRSLKHLGDALSGSACKRLNMYLRWMVRPATGGVDFGLWKKLDPAKLSIPLDVHSGKTARILGILKRKANDLKAVYELDNILRRFDVKDPVKYDFALFGIGVYEPDFQK
jgi:uncharacterized protein (TIGR02757 family)